MGYRMQADWPAHGPRQFFYPSNYIALGWAFPAALGAAVALPGQPVVSVSGDGGFLMTAQELATAVRYKLPVIAIVHNDSTYGAIKNIQQRVHRRYLDVELNNPDFLALAAASACPGTGPRTGGIPRRRPRALDRGGPALSRSPTAGGSFATWRRRFAEDADRIAQQLMRRRANKKSPVRVLKSPRH